MIPNHPEPEQIVLENVLFALGNPLRLAIIRRLADGSELSCNAAPGRGGEIHYDSPLARAARQRRDLAAPAGAREYDFTEKRGSGRPLSGTAGDPAPG